MKTRTCTCCGETFPATNKYFDKHKKGKYGLRPRCKTCCKEQRAEYNSRPEVKKMRAEYESRPEVKTRKAEHAAKPESKAKKRKTQKKRYESKRIAEGKPLGTLAPKRFFYIGYLHETHGTYLKVGITSYDSMKERCLKGSNKKIREEFIDCQMLRWVEFDTEDEARDMEKRYIAHCTKELGDPVLRQERFRLPKPVELYNILENI